MSYEVHHVDSHQQTHSFSFSGIGLDAICALTASKISDSDLLHDLQVGSEMGYLWIDDRYQGVLPMLVDALAELQSSYAAIEARGRLIVDRGDYVGIRHLKDSLLNPLRGLGASPDRH